jgi:hypothetical protein
MLVTLIPHIFLFGLRKNKNNFSYLFSLFKCKYMIFSKRSRKNLFFEKRKIKQIIEFSMDNCNKYDNTFSQFLLPRITPSSQVHEVIGIGLSET